MNYPNGISSAGSVDALRQQAYFFICSVGVAGGVYVCSLSSLKVDLFLKNNSETCNEIKMLCGFGNGIVFIDLGARKVKF